MHGLSHTTEAALPAAEGEGPGGARAAPSPGTRGALTLRNVTVTVVLACGTAAALNPLFMTPFPVLLARILVVAMLLLGVFLLAGRWRPRRVPRWLAQVVAVAVAAPAGTALVYLPAVRGDLSMVLRHDALLLGFVLTAGCALLLGTLLAFGAVYRERDAEAHAQALQLALLRSTVDRQRLDAQMRLLQGQIEPHFLFNTLANVQALVESGSPRAAGVLQSLVDYLRAAVPRLAEPASTLADEVALVRAYLALMQMRMPDRLAPRVELPAELAALPFPRMALLTLVENAVRHGIDPSEAGGTIEVGGALDDAARRARVWVADSGVGFGAAPTAGAGTGLANLRARLETFYRGQARLVITEQVPRGVRAEIDFEVAAAPGAADLSLPEATR